MSQTGREGEEVSLDGRLEKLEATTAETARSVEVILNKVRPSLVTRALRFTFRIMVIAAIAMVYHNSSGENPISLEKCSENFDQQSRRASNIRALVERLQHASTDEEREDLLKLLKTLSYDAEEGSRLIIRQCVPIDIPTRTH